MEGRILALDWGKRRIGLATCDELRLTVQGLPTLTRTNRTADLETLTTLITDRNIRLLVVGEPNPSPNSTSQAEQFGRALAKRAKLDLVMWDERLTSFEADSILDESGSGRRDKGDTDRLSAVLILESYLRSCPQPPKSPSESSS